MSKLEVSIKKAAESSGCSISRDLASTVAAHLEGGYVFIPRSDLPEVTGNGDLVEVNGENWCIEGVWENPLRWRERAMNYLTIAEYLEAGQSAARDKRQDELARELVSDGAYAYRFADEPLKLAIDRIIALEEAAS